MFSGIIETIGDVTAVAAKEWGSTISVTVGFDTAKVKIGDSIAINGVCLTVVKIEAQTLTFDVVHESLRCSSLGSLQQGNKVNVERSVVVGSRIDGHIVSGHVDTTTKLLAREDTGSLELKFVLPKTHAQYIVPKGSITISGVSLTVGVVTAEYFSVYIVPHTAKETVLGNLNIGEVVNIEIDMLARYVMEGIRHYASR